MKIGYACICLKEPKAPMRTCTMKFVTETKLQDIISNNLTSLKDILRYNKELGILMFRISSDLIPFGSSPINHIPWRTLYQKEFQALGDYIKKNQLRVSMHPGQYTLINSPRNEVVERAILDLQYHCDILDLMGLDASHKLILHVGGVYGDKTASIKRFITNYRNLSDTIQKRLVIENDDHFYHIGDVLKIGIELSIPVVFDNLHHAILHPDDSLTDYDWLMLTKKTWKKEDGMQKMHYSEQNPLKRVGAHALSLTSHVFLNYLESIKYRNDLDIMIEIKDKNLSAMKAIQLLCFDLDLQITQWHQYQYLIMERDYEQYLWLDEHITTLQAVVFYQTIEQVLLMPPKKALQEKLLVIILEDISCFITPKEYQSFNLWIIRFKEDKATISRLKKIVYRLASQYNVESITQSYYFLNQN